LATYSFRDARRLVIEQTLAARKLETEVVPLSEAAGRVIAEFVSADRDYPPVARSIRDGFAVRAADLPGTLDLIGEVRAGGEFAGEVGVGQCVEIMTGAAVPKGADAIVMVEYAVRDGGRVTIDRRPAPREFINPGGAEARAGQAVMPAGFRLGFTQIALLATFGKTKVKVYRRPRVAILSTGDEVVPIEATPLDTQVRNSNAHSVAVQVARAGGVPTILPVAPDEKEATRRLICEGLEHDMLLLSGGVSAGKYDYVEPVLSELGAEFFFDRVLMQPGQPLVFGRARERFFFGLPGNPASTMVTFEVFGRAAVELLGGQQNSDLRLPRLKLTGEFRHKPGLTRFLPARINEDATEVTPVRWQGSSDVAALARANAFMVCDSETESWQAGDSIGVLFQ
jgi:molybdopterin molybdotransferase